MQQLNNMKTKMFKHSYSASLESAYIKWLSDNENITIISTALSQYNDYLIFIVTYTKTVTVETKTEVD